MRITAQAKELTRQKILSAAEDRFRTAGFDATTTRDIAQAAGIATGTLFNYFPTKESIVGALIMDAQPEASPESAEAHDSLEEALFAHAAGSLRVLKPYRKFLRPLLETAFSPLVEAAQDDVGQALRTTHLEAVCTLAKPFIDADAMTQVALQMYWTLFLGVLAHWIGDKSPKQEDTLALLDQSMAMFVGWLPAAKTD